jgi:hypothetical protein
MMKTKILEKPGVCICGLTGDEFPHDHSKAGRAAAIEKLTEHQAQSLKQMSDRQPELTTRQHFSPSTIPHAETRTKEELRAKRAADAPKQPSGIPTAPINPFDRTVEAEIKRHSALWETSYEGRRVIANLKRQSKEWEARQTQKQQQQQFETSIAPVVDHAQASLDAVRRNPAATQAEVDQAIDRLRIAQSGNIGGYSAADKEWREVQANKLVTKAVEVDAQAKQLQSQRDALLQAAYEPLKESAEPTMVDVHYPSFYHDPDKAGRIIKEPMPTIG